MTGVSSLADVVAARPEERPTWMGHDLTALGRAGAVATCEPTGWSSGSWRARIDGGRLVVEGDGSEPAALDAWWTAVAVAAWDHLDRTGEPADTSGVTEPGRPSTPG
jgi:hypothetical protein